MANFQENIDGHVVIPGTYTATGGTTNFHIGYPPAQDRSTRNRKPFSTVPFAPDRDFVNRPEILEWVHEKCAGPGARAALVGLGGVGKSQLAIQYAHSIRDATPHIFVFWVHASTKARFEEAYRGLAAKLALPGRDDLKADVLRLVSDWLCDETNGKWIMIVDNADDVGMFFPSQAREQGSLATYLPQSRNGSILITSRNKDVAARLVGGYKYIRDVLAMDESQSLQLLRNKLQDSSTEEGAADLLQVLGCMPLAITQAAAYINRRARMTILSYLNEFHANDKRRESLLNWDAGDLRRDESASGSVVTTWQMSFERIRHERPSAADLLSLMSFFNPQGIPGWVLRPTARRGCQDEADDTFDKDLDTLQAYSLIIVTPETDTCEIHPLVQFCTQVWLSSFSDVDGWRQKFVELMARKFPSGVYETWAQCQQLLPHIESLFDAELATSESIKPLTKILTNATWYMYLKGHFKIGEKLATKAVTARERLLGPDDERTLTSVSYLASVLQHQGKYSEAEKLHQQALEGREKELGVRHPDTLSSVNNLASVLSNQGKYSEAEKLFRRALEGREKELGVQHPDMLSSVNNLASVLSNQGKYTEAEKLHRRALEGSEKELGVQHPDTLTSVNNLANVLWNQGKYSEAEKLHRRALEGSKKELGVQHPDTLNSINNLANVLRDQGKYSEAEKLHRRALEGREKELGVQHPNTLISVNNLAYVLQDQGKYSEAEKLFRRALEGREKELGVQHPDTLTSVNNLASVLQDQGKYSEAEKLFRRALEGREKELGVQHPNTLTSVNNLAYVLEDQGKYSEAEKLFRRALEGREKELGVQHPDTLLSIYFLAHLLYMQKQYESARELYQRACIGFEQTLGPQHPTTIACLSHFSAMKQEANQAKLNRSKPSIHRDKTSFSDVTRSKGRSGLGSSGLEDKQGSILMRVKRRFRRKDV